MPELPEVENVRLSLAPIVGKRVVRVLVNRWDVVEPTTRSRQPGLPGLRKAERLLEGGSIAQLLRHGKHLALVVDDGRAVDVQLGMSGQVLLAKPGKAVGPVTHLHVIWTLDDGSSVGFRDPRRFGGLWPFSGLDQLKETRWGSLGPDALDATPEALVEGLTPSRRSIKAVLMDQGVIAGLGNIYVAEALFHAGIRPTRAAARLSKTDWSRLMGCVRNVLSEAIEAGGSTLRDYSNARGESGNFQRRHAVYGRAGEACVRCAGRLRSGVIAQRTTVWCSHCQR